MIILKKKRLIIIAICLLMGCFAFSFQMGLQDKVMPTVTLPVSSKVIVLDAGHGYPDNGASSNSGITENEINLKITQKVQELLETSGATIILTRSDENGIYDLDKNTLREKKVSDIKNRVKIGNNAQADCFISIHLNKIPQSQYDGWQTFYKKGNQQGEELAKSIQAGLNASIQKQNNRQSLAISDKYIVEHVTIPLSIVECGFLSNPEEEKQLQQDDYQNRLAWGIYTGIMDYFYSDR